MIDRLIDNINKTMIKISYKDKYETNISEYEYGNFAVETEVEIEI